MLPHPASDGDWCVIPVDVDRDRASVAALWTAYITEQARRVLEETGVDQDLTGIEQICLKLLPACSAPQGFTLLAVAAGEAIGVAACRPLRPRVAEVKRLYVSPRWRGRGVGRALMTELIGRAIDHGHHHLWLDAGWWATSALALYADLGFAPQPPYDEAEIAPEIAPRWQFRALDLTSGVSISATAGVAPSDRLG